MATKHDQILAYIETLPVGERISVRRIAKNLEVSEGTAYRAIKDAEVEGLVSTIQRVGTIRIERKMKEHIEKLTFEEVVTIIEGEVLGGQKGLDKSLNKFIIGAMTEEAMKRYLAADSLVIVGNREEAQRLALQYGAAVLITGGFDTNKEIVALADRLERPIIRTTYDTFTVATMINRALNDQSIKKEIILVGDVFTPIERTNYLLNSTTIEDYQKLAQTSGHSRFPVVNKNMRLIGIITAKDVVGKNNSQMIEKVMTKDPRCAKTHMSVASVGHMMIWDGLEIMPVVADDLTLLGIISRQDVMKTMQIAQRQPQVADTIADQIAGEIEEQVNTNPLQPEEQKRFSVTVTPQMINSVGTVSFGVLSEIVANVAERAMYEYERKNMVIEQVNLHYFRLIQLESQLEVRPKVLDIGRRSAKLDVTAYLDNVLVAKALVVCQLMEQG